VVTGVVMSNNKRTLQLEHKTKARSTWVMVMDQDHHTTGVACIWI
jgi:streptomycin 6-kinase